MNKRKKALYDDAIRLYEDYYNSIVKDMNKDHKNPLPASCGLDWRTLNIVNPVKHDRLKQLYNLVIMYERDLFK